MAAAAIVTSRLGDQTQHVNQGVVLGNAAATPLDARGTVEEATTVAERHAAKVAEAAAATAVLLTEMRAQLEADAAWLAHARSAASHHPP